MYSVSHDAESPCAAVRAAACQAVRALSRSAKDLRSELVRPDMGAALCRLLRDADPRVQVAASAALCNLVLHFSPIKVRDPPVRWFCPVPSPCPAGRSNGVDANREAEVEIRAPALLHEFCR